MAFPGGSRMQGVFAKSIPNWEGTSVKRMIVLALMGFAALLGVASDSRAGVQAL